MILLFKFKIKKEGGKPPREPSFAYLQREDAAGSVRVGRVVERPVPVQGPQADVGEEKESRQEQPGDLQQPLLSPPHVPGRVRAKPATPLFSRREQQPEWRRPPVALRLQQRHAHTQLPDPVGGFIIKDPKEGDDCWWKS